MRFSILQRTICKRCDDVSSDATRIGCPCQTDFDCQGGAETNLVCWGSEDAGWIPTKQGGKCLPDGSAQNHEWHEEHRWFCLDNCEAMALGSSAFGCYYDQDPGGLGKAEHGECINLNNSCGPEYEIPGECELQENIQCVELNGVTDCVPECTTTEDCVLRGFPASYVCDADSDAGFAPGHCVPPECANSSSEYCDLFR